MIAFVEEHQTSTPLDFMNAMVARDPDLAGYFAYQIRRMHTPVGPRLENSPYFQSAYPGILVEGPGSTEMVTGAIIRYEDPEKHAASMTREAQGSVQMQVLLRDFRRSIDRQNRRSAGDPGLGGDGSSSVFPLGVATTISSESSPMAGRGNGVSAHAQSGSVIAALERMPDGPGVEETEWLKELTVKHPAAAAFLGVVREGILLQNINPEKRCKRFNYVDSGDCAPLLDQMRDNRSMWGATFLEGIERNFSVSGNKAGSWRIRDGDDWITGGSEADVLKHVMSQAMGHLDAATPPAADTPLFPLCVYECLAKALGKPVPRYLKEREEQVVTMVTANHAAATAKRAQQDAAYREREAVKAEAGEWLQRSYAAEGAKDEAEMDMCRSGLSPEKITRDSIERSFSLVPTGQNRLQAVRDFNEKIMQTHVRQEIQCKWRGTQRNDSLDYARATWLSVLSSASPEQLGARLEEMQDDPSRVPHARVHSSTMMQIAEIFRADPVGFLQGGDADRPWSQAIRQPAQLGENLSFVPNAVSEFRKAMKPMKTELLLEFLLRDIAAGFRKENPQILTEAARTLGPGNPGSMSMVTALHRAFKVPALIVEVGEQSTDAQGAPDVDLARVRLAAVKGTPLADQIASHDESPDATGLADDGNQMQAVVDQFENRPVIWFENGRYSVYLPKTLVNQ